MPISPLHRPHNLLRPDVDLRCWRLDLGNTLHAGSRSEWFLLLIIYHWLLPYQTFRILASLAQRLLYILEHPEGDALVVSFSTSFFVYR